MYDFDRTLISPQQLNFRTSTLCYIYKLVIHMMSMFTTKGWTGIT